MSILSIKADTQDNTGEWHYISMKGFPLSVKGNGATCPFIGHGTYVYTVSDNQFTIETYEKNYDVSILSKPKTTAQPIGYLFDSMSELIHDQLKNIIEGDELVLIRFVNTHNLTSFRLCCSVVGFKKAYYRWLKDTKK